MQALRDSTYSSNRSSEIIMDINRGLTRLSYIILTVGLAVFAFYAWRVWSLYPMFGHGDLIDIRIIDLAQHGLLGLFVGVCGWWIIQGFVGK